MADGSMAWRRLMEYLDDNRDAFENEIANRTNVLDLAAHYHYSPERWRLFVDGSRVFPEYGSVAQYDHDVDRHALQPAAGIRSQIRQALLDKPSVGYIPAM